MKLYWRMLGCAFPVYDPRRSLDAGRFRLALFLAIAGFSLFTKELGLQSLDIFLVAIRAAVLTSALQYLAVCAHAEKK